MEETTFEQTVYTINEFLSIDVKTWGERLKSHHLLCMQQPASGSQRKAWYDCFIILRREIEKIESRLADDVYIVFEYELPRERGRRPDVLILSGSNLVVLEFKGYTQENQAQIDQAKHYARDFQNYHFESSSLNVIPVLVLTEGIGKIEVVDNIHILSGEQLGIFLKPYLEEQFSQIEKWFESEYAPLPSLVKAAQLLFKENSFPQIKRSQSAGIPETLKLTHQIACIAEKDNSRHLVLITGVPGAGKTLVGLQFVFEHLVQEEQKAVFLSGNGPLVQVLQTSLRSRHFVQGVHGFLKQYAHSNQMPREDVIIYDEAQRAWDSEKVTNSNREGNNSEPVDFIRIADRKEHCVMIGLIGEGQEIHLGEESGMDLWTEAINKSKRNWKIHCPEKLIGYFPDFDTSIVEEFNLTTSLRTHQALTLQKWVVALLENQIITARKLSSSLFDENYPIYLTRDLSTAKHYIQMKYYQEVDKTFGLIASSKSVILPKYSIKNDFNSTRFQAEYYIDSTSPYYCCRLNHVVTEFGCQGLELDMPLLAWEADWLYDKGWKNKAPNHKARDPDNLKKNVYRVLLTRGRDGLVIFIPDNPILNSTYNILLEAGCKTI